MAGDEPADLRLLIFFEFEHQLVVDLEQHLGVEPGYRTCSVDVDHGKFDHVGRRPLDRHVDRLALRVLAKVHIVAVQIGQIAPSAEKRLNIPVSPRGFDGIVDVLLDFRKPLEVARDDLLRLRLRNLQAICQSVRSDPVHNTEVHLFGFPPHLSCHVVQGNSEHLRSS